MIWWIAAAMLIVALIILITPLWRTRNLATLDSNTANVAVLKDQLQELEADFANGNMTEEQYDGARIDLEASVAADLVEDADHVVQPMSVKTRRSLSLILIVSLPLASVALYREITTSQTQPTQQQVARQNMAQQARQEMPSIDQMVETLAAKLRDNPDNAEGWQMLGKSYLVLDRMPDAVKAYARAYELLGDTNAELLADYAEVLAFSSDDNMQGKPAELVNKALQLDPQHAKSLWLAGFAAMQNEDPGLALRHWQALLSSPVLDEQTREMVKRNISQVRGISGPSSVSAAPQVVASEAADVPAVEDKAMLSVKVDVALDDSLKGKVTADEIVYVFARPSQGMPMPLAVKRLTVADLPTTVILDDSMAMLKGNNLSGHDEVIVGARVSRDGTPIPRSGDLQGLGSAINPRVISSQSIIINEVVN
ncbi:MAG: c-type cytochrome biogenesis protein CcmI [Gammaproteobacteria bacterium]|nr:c-type cytochrome biogenesis protein CcmI [Gammaproteobacteria bacterium]